jgi:hypothetical protein
MSSVIVQKPSPSVTPIEIARVQDRIRKLVCSSPWFDRCWEEFAEGRLKDRKRIDHALNRAEVYPPGGIPRRGLHRTLMRRCILCGGKWLPPQYVRGCGLCEDCAADFDAPAVTDERTHVSTPGSPIAEALRAMEHYQVRLTESPLAAEDEASLRAEIDAYLREHPAGSGAHP